MANTIKKYQLLKGFQLSTVFLVNGVKIPVTFQYGIRRPFLSRGYFATGDPDLQAAIESDNAFGDIFGLVESKAELESEPEQEVVTLSEAEEVVENEVQEETEEASEVPPDTTPEHIEEIDKQEEKPEGPTDYPEVTNLQEARAKLIELFPTELKLNNLPNQKAVFNRAKERKITFSKLV